MKSGAPCCAGGSCEPKSRYPVQPKITISNKDWKQPASPASPQFNQGCCGANSTCCGPKNTASPPFTYSGANLAAVDFPVGGFGAGNVKIAGDGTIDKYTILNQPAECISFMPNNFFGISTAPTNNPSQKQSFVLQSPETYTTENCNLPTTEPAHVPRGSVKRLKNLPGINSITLTGKYPIANLKYNITNFPINVSMEATSPCIPQDVKNSSLPCGIFTFTVTNPSATESMHVRILQSQQNIIGWDGISDCSEGSNTNWGGNINTPSESSTCSSLSMSTTNAANDNGNMNLSGIKSVNSNVTVITSAKDSVDIFNKFVTNQDQSAKNASASSPSFDSVSTCCGIVQSITLAPSQTATLTFVLSWYFPTRTLTGMGLQQWSKILPSDIGNRYCDWFQNSADVINYVLEKYDYLLDTTRLYTETMFASTIPPELLDSAAGRVACMRSATMFWTNQSCSLNYGSNGCILGSEGNGCCMLNCTHVYGYTTLMERLFPSFAKDRRISDFVRNFDITQGGDIMRFGTGGWAIDGALANIIKTYLVVRQSDPQLLFLSVVWSNIKEQMKYVQDNFDVDGDGIIRKPQQNTYDSPMNGANTFIGSYYVTALKAMAAMSTLMNETEAASTFSKRAVLSATNYEKICWNNDFGYYTADVTKDNCKYSYGPGCFVDQLCCIGLSSAVGFEHVFNPIHEAIARRSLLRNNLVIKPPFQDLQNHFYNGDIGICVCTYPNGKLGDGMMYETIVSTGFTSPNISGMLLDRNVTDACTIAQHIRTRHNGLTASPWNEPECNQLYSRAMAHFNIFDQACGFKYSCIDASLTFDPRMNQTNFRCFVSLNNGWGNYSQTGVAGRRKRRVNGDGINDGNVETKDQEQSIVTLASGHCDLTCLWGEMVVRTLNIMTTATQATATVNGKGIPIASFLNGVVTFTTDVTLNVTDVLSIALTGGIEKSDTWVIVGDNTNSSSRQRQPHAHGHGHGHGHDKSVKPPSCCGENNGKKDCCGTMESIHKTPSMDDFNDDFNDQFNDVESSTSRYGKVQIFLIFVAGMVCAVVLQKGLAMMNK